MERSTPKKGLLDTEYLFVCGYAGSGKSLYARILADGLDANFLEVSSIVREITSEDKRSGIGNRPELDKEIIRRIRMVSKPCVISGVRQQSILDAFPGNPVVFVDTPFNLRRDRMSERGDNKDDASLELCDSFDNQLGLGKIAENIHHIKR